jgi:hypothetical protein
MVVACHLHIRDLGSIPSDEQISSKKKTFAETRSLRTGKRFRDRLNLHGHRKCPPGRAVTCVPGELI